MSAMAILRQLSFGMLTFIRDDARTKDISESPISRRGQSLDSAVGGFVQLYMGWNVLLAYPYAAAHQRAHCKVTRRNSTN